jgi:hypothetical protein
MAYRMQASVPDLTDLSDEPKHVLEMYGPDVHKPGSYARNCLMARRLAERGVRFVQLFHVGWDTHRNLVKEITMQCEDTDRPSAALITDLKQRGMLDDTLVVWSGEFGRTVYSQGDPNDPTAGRDHHGRCYTIWMAGGGVKPASPLAKPTTTRTTSSATPFTSMICRPRCSTCSAWTTSASPSSSRAVIFGLPTLPARSSSPF